MSHSGGAPIRVLHVDDEPDLLEIAKRALEREDDRFEVVTESDVEAAVDRLDDEQIDCIVSDYEMPRMNGLEFLETVRASHPDLPFILYTGKGSEEIASEAISAGVTEYLQKETGTEQYTVLANRIERAVSESRAETALEESERMLSTLISNLPGMVYRAKNEPEWPMQFVSEGCRDLTGYEPEQLESGDVVWGPDVLHPEDEGTMWETVQEALDAREPFEVTYRIVTADGETKWAWEQGRGVFEDGELVALEGFIIDITERRQAEQRLQKYETIVESIPDGAYVLDENREFEFVNESLARAMNADPEDLVGQTSFMLSGAADETGLAEYEALLDQLERGEETQVRAEFDMTFPDGTERTLNLRLTRLEDEGEFAGIVGIARDLTERKERERELERYETIIQAVGDPVYALDSAGRFTFVNDAIEPLTGRSPSDLVGEHVSVVMADDDIETAEELIQELLRSEDRTNGTFEMALLSEDGEEVPTENHMALLPFNEDGEFRGTAGIVRDITERKQREQRLEDFVSVVSHDLRNPLNVIRGRIEVARETGDISHLEAAEESVDRMYRLIADLLSLARQGQTVGDRESVDLDSLAEHAWNHVETREATLTVEDPPTVSADPDRLDELFENLFRNAVVHGPEGVTVRVGALDDDGFYVADDGPGIPTEEREQVFDHGYSQREGGTGFGLSIVRNVAEAHGWSIRITESRAGGARFEIRVDD